MIANRNVSSRTLRSAGENGFYHVLNSTTLQPMDSTKPKRSKKEVAARMSAFFDAIKMTHDKIVAVAAEHGRQITRVVVSKVNTGANQVTSADVLFAIAAGTGVNPVQLDMYIDGKIGLPDLLRERMMFQASSEKGAATARRWEEFRGWDEAEKAAWQLNITSNMGLTKENFRQTRTSAAFMAPERLDGQFVLNLVWLLSRGKPFVDAGNPRPSGSHPVSR